MVKGLLPSITLNEPVSLVTWFIPVISPEQNIPEQDIVVVVNPPSLFIDPVEIILPLLNNPSHSNALPLVVTVPSDVAPIEAIELL